MNEKLGSYQVVDLPPARREMPNLLNIYWCKHMVYGLLEVDVTVARQFITVAFDLTLSMGHQRRGLEAGWWS